MLGTPIKTNSAGFTYVIKSCPDMNLVRAKMGIAEYPCAQAEDIVAAQSTFSVLIGMIHETFDNWEYNQDGGLQS